MAKQFTLGKDERLKSRKQIEQLFSEGRAVTAFPIRVQYKLIDQPNTAPLQAGFSASSRNFKKAVDRNRIKRLLRETYRLQKRELIEVLKVQRRIGYVFFIYTDKQMPQYPIVFDTMSKCLEVLKRKAINEDRS